MLVVSDKGEGRDTKEDFDDDPDIDRLRGSSIGGKRGLLGPKLDRRSESKTRRA